MTAEAIGRRRVYSGGPLELKVGYCRATRVGDQVFVSGSTAIKDGQVVGVDDMAAQTRQTLQTIAAALEQSGSSLAEVVRYRVYVTDAARQHETMPVLAEFFGDVHPCGTLVVVSALVLPELLVEIEVDAIVGSAAPV